MKYVLKSQFNNESPEVIGTYESREEAEAEKAQCEIDARGCMDFMIEEITE